MSIKTFSDFRSNFSLKNGEIGDQNVLNRPIDRLKREIDLISNFLKASLGMPVSDWDFGSFYEYESIVRYDDSLYMSIKDDNTGHIPTDTEFWMPLPYMSSSTWDEKILYNAGDVIRTSDGLLYTSKQNNNLGFNPKTFPAYWDELSTKFRYLKATHDMLIEGDSQMDGDLTVGSLSVNNNKAINIITNSDYTSRLSLYGENNGSGQMFIGRDFFNGGGLEYYGTSLFDDSIPTAGADYLTLYRKFGGDWSWTARNHYTSDDWEFAGSMDINQNLTVNGTALFLGDAPGSGLTTVRHNFEVLGTATFNDDIILNGSASFGNNLGVFGDIHVTGTSDLDGEVTTLDNVTLNKDLTNWTRIKGHTYAEGNMDVTGDTLARGHFGTEQGVTLNTLGGTTTIKGATTIDDILNVTGSVVLDGNTTLNDNGGVTLIKGVGTANSDFYVKGNLFLDDGDASSAVFRGTSAQNTGMAFQTDGINEWLMYRTTSRDLLINARNYNNAGGVKNALLINWDTAIVDFYEQAYFKKASGLPPFKVDSNVKVPNLNADLLDGISSGSFVRSDATDTVSGALTFTATPTISGSSAGLKFNDTSGEDDFWVHVNSNNFYILADRDDSGAWDGSYPLQLESDTNKGYCFGGEIITSSNSTIIPNKSGIGNYGSLMIDGGATGGWEGLSIGGRAVLMHDNASTFGMYDDVNNEWLIRSVFNAGTYLYYNGASKLETTSYGSYVSGYLQASASLRAPIFYDSNNTAYYGNFAGESRMNEVKAYYLERYNHHTGHLVGSYNNVGANSYKSNPIYTIGSSYNPSDAALENMYGIGYSHTNASFIGTQAGTGWGMYVAEAGNARIFLNGSNGVAYLTATSAYYADVAENYLADKVYEPGTVMGIGGENEITEWKPGMPLAGVISTDPALQMNNGEEQANNELYIPVALKGKIPCFVSSDIKKGQYLIADVNGKAYGVDDYDFAQSKILIGVALEDSENGSVMVKV